MSPLTTTKVLPDLGLLGKARSGKDTTAEYLVRRYGYTRVAFADALKAAAVAVDPIVEVYSTHWGGAAFRRLSDVVAEVGMETAKNTVPEVRRFLQALGVSMRDHVDPEVWVGAAVRIAQQAEGPVVFTDVRFPNEAAALERLGFRLVRIVRPGAGLDGPAGAHSSETALDGRQVDAEVLNDGTIEDLHRRIDGVVGAFR